MLSLGELRSYLQALTATNVRLPVGFPNLNKFKYAVSLRVLLFAVFGVSASQPHVRAAHAFPWSHRDR